MAQQLAIHSSLRERVTTPPGTGNATLAGAVSQYRQFSSKIADGIPFPYSMRGESGTLWEVGIGVLSSGALVRRVLDSSAGFLTLANFSSGVQQVVSGPHSFLRGLECTIGTGQNGSLNVTGSTDIELSDDVHYTSLSWGVGATAKINTHGFRVYAHQANFTNAPAGAINNDAVGTTGGGWGTVGGGIDCGANTDPNGFGALPAAILGGLGGDPDGAGNAPGRLAKLIGRLAPFASTAGIAAGGTGYDDTGTRGAGAGVVEAFIGLLTRATAGSASIRANGSAAVTDGSGGGGGRVRLHYYSLAGTAHTGFLQANGGNGAGTGNNGGDGGACESYNLSTGANTFQAGSTTTSGTAGTCSVNI